MAASRDGSFPGSDAGIAGQVRELIQLFNESDMSEFRIEQGDLKLYIARQNPTAVGQALPCVELPPAEETPVEQSFITAPMVGRFYLSAPGNAPLVTCGNPITKGQKICIVESMKMPHDILAEIDCLVEEILCEDGQAVEYGQSLFRVRLQPID